MTAFDASWIEEVNRIQLRPDEMVVFRTEENISQATYESFRHWADQSPLKGRVLLLTGQWEIDTVLLEGET